MCFAQQKCKCPCSCVFMCYFQWQSFGGQHVTGESLLHAGARGGCSEVVTLLVEKGCDDVNEKDALVRIVVILMPLLIWFCHLILFFIV